MKFLLLTLILLSYSKLVAQEDWNYLFNQQHDRAVELFNHHYYGQEYQQALPHLEWMLDEQPGKSVSQYIMGIDVYEKIARKIEDPEERYRYTQLALKLYDERIRYFGDTVKVLNRKLGTAYGLLYADSSYHQQLYALSKEVLERSGKEFAYYNFMPHAFLLNQMLSKGKIDEEEAKAAAEQLSRIAAYHAQGQGSNRYEEVMPKVRQILDSHEIP